MKLNYLKEKKELVWISNLATSGKRRSLSIVLLGVSAFLGVLVLVKVAGFFVAPARAENMVKRAVEQSKLDANDIKKYFAESKAIADQLRKKNLFAPPPPKQQPIKQVLGILGYEALINGKWYKAGDMVQDAKIVAIEPTKIRFEWNGRQITLAPINATSPSGPRGPKPVVAKAEEGEQRAEVVQVQLEERPAFGRGGPGEGFRNLRERWANMSEEEREALRARMRERFGGRGPGGERGPGGGRGPGGRRR